MRPGPWHPRRPSRRPGLEADSPLARSPDAVVERDPGARRVGSSGSPLPPVLLYALGRTRPSSFFPMRVSSCAAICCRKSRCDPCVLLPRCGMDVRGQGPATSRCALTGKSSCEGCMMRFRVLGKIACRVLGGSGSGECSVNRGGHVRLCDGKATLRGAAALEPKAQGFWWDRPLRRRSVLRSNVERIVAELRLQYWGVINRTVRLLSLQEPLDKHVPRAIVHSFTFSVAFSRAGAAGESDSPRSTWRPNTSRARKVKT